MVFQILLENIFFEMKVHLITFYPESLHFL